MLLTRSPLTHHRSDEPVRLACVKHAASVRPEPGSNSPKKPGKSKNPDPTKHVEPTKQTALTATNTLLSSQKTNPSCGAVLLFPNPTRAWRLSQNRPQPICYRANSGTPIRTADLLCDCREDWQAVRDGRDRPSKCPGPCRSLTLPHPSSQLQPRIWSDRNR